jgi:tight adherence protein C
MTFADLPAVSFPRLDAVDAAILLVALLVFAGSALALSRTTRRQTLDARLARAAGSGTGPETRPRGAQAETDAVAGAGPLHRLGEMVGRSPLVGREELAKIRATIVGAGLSPAILHYFLGVKLMLVLAGAAGSLLWMQAAGHGAVPAFMAMTVAALLGWRLPDLAAARIRRARREAVERGLPDAIDLLVICSEAGLGLETSIDRVSREIAPVHPALGRELATVAAEMRVLSDRTAALSNMADRLDLTALRTIAGTLGQTMRYGTPLAQALRVLAAEMRTLRLTRFEERAARLPVLITLPMICFILPCVLIVVGGPAALDVIAMLKP